MLQTLHLFVEEVVWYTRFASMERAQQNACSIAIDEPKQNSSFHEIEASAPSSRRAPAHVVELGTLTNTGLWAYGPMGAFS